MSSAEAYFMASIGPAPFDKTKHIVRAANPRAWIPVPYHGCDRGIILLVGLDERFGPAGLGKGMILGQNHQRRPRTLDSSRPSRCGSGKLVCRYHLPPAERLKSLRIY